MALNLHFQDSNAAPAVSDGPLDVPNPLLRDFYPIDSAKRSYETSAFVQQSAGKMRLKE